MMTKQKRFLLKQILTMMFIKTMSIFFEGSNYLLQRNQRFLINIHRMFLFSLCLDYARSVLLQRSQSSWEGRESESWERAGDEVWTRLTCSSTEEEWGGLVCWQSACRYHVTEDWSTSTSTETTDLDRDRDITLTFVYCSWFSQVLGWLFHSQQICS